MVCLPSCYYADCPGCFAVQGTVGSTFFQQVRRIIQTPDQIPNILGAALPDSSNFFMQFIAMRALFLVWLRLCVPHGGVWQNWCHFCFCPASCCSTCNTGALARGLNRIAVRNTYTSCHALVRSHTSHQLILAVGWHRGMAEMSRGMASGDASLCVIA